MLINSIQFQRRNDQWDLLIEYIVESPVFWFIIITFITLIVIKKTRKEFHSHWNTLLDGCTLSSKEFYDELKNELLATKISGVGMTQVHLREGGFLSLRRKYLRVTWKDYRYDICAAPFGNGFFISWWLLNKIDIIQLFISRFPLGLWFVKKMNPVTYYKIDTASMFQTYCHQAVLKVIESMTKTSGVRSLTEDQKKPILNNKNIFKR